MSRFLGLLLTLSTLSASDVRFSDTLWQGNKDIYARILDHPFLEGLGKGTLRREAFTFYMIQDAHYLREFSRALNITASKAPRDDWGALLSRHAAETLEVERQLHENVFKEYGISSEQVERTAPAPEAFAYTSFLVANAYSASFGESLAALLPCYWIYWEVGKELKRKGSPDPVYRKWIDAYSAEGYGASVKAVLEVIDTVAEQADSRERAQMQRNFRRTCRYEWMFWDSAYHLRKWPPLDDR